jgi:hypothetical protein
LTNESTPKEVTAPAPTGLRIGVHSGATQAEAVRVEVLIADFLEIEKWLYSNCQKKNK